MKIDCIIAYSGEEETRQTIKKMRRSGLTGSVYVISPVNASFEHAETLVSLQPLSVGNIRQIALHVKADFALVALQAGTAEPGQFALERLAGVASDTGAGMVYSDYYEIKEGKTLNHPVNDYQQGSLRDEFNFGPAQLFPKEVLQAYPAEVNETWEYAGYYALRLLASRMGELVRIPEYLFTTKETDTRQSGEKMFDYVSGSARARQIEMEAACTTHLKKIGAFLKPGFREVLFSGSFPVEATVVIPVRNRVRTIGDAVDSVLKQETTFPFNLIVVDNHSTDGTTELLAQYNDQRLICLQPERTDLGIGGCWNEAVFHNQCGRFAVQLDSDDLYAGTTTLQQIVDKFHKEKCAMVIGSYQMCDFMLNPIPPGIIDHKEWSPDNGPNNALRINGLGAPRAFYTPVVREIRIPNTSYGEDYAIGLAISRKWKIGRIYEPVYLCRRWEDNSDASLDVAKLNAHDAYKDKLRTIELKTRIRMNELSAISR
ncbi:MAG: glycosyltransferase family A protein [Prolixibacteraceae bacterium]